MISEPFCLVLPVSLACSKPLDSQTTILFLEKVSFLCKPPSPYKFSMPSKLKGGRASYLSCWRNKSQILPARLRLRVSLFQDLSLSQGIQSWRLQSCQLRDEFDCEQLEKPNQHLNTERTNGMPHFMSTVEVQLCSFQRHCLSMQSSEKSVFAW